MPDMAAEVPQTFERRKDVAWEAAHVTQKAINFFDAKPLIKKGLDFFIRGWRSRLAEFVGDPLCELASRANYDDLTGLPNKRALIDWLNAKFMVDMRTGTRVEDNDRRQHDFFPFCVAFCDVDNFTKVNENFGHTVGNTVLQAVAKELNRNVRSGDQIGRYGGDEMVAIFDTIRTPNAGVELTERLREDFSRNFKNQWCISLSIGLVHVLYEDLKMISGIAKQHGVTMADLVLAAADSAAYSAKEEGRDRVVSWSKKTKLKPIPEAADDHDKAIHEALVAWQIRTALLN